MDGVSIRCLVHRRHRPPELNMGIATDALAGNPTDLAEITVQISLAITGKRTQPSPFLTAMRTHPLHSLSLLAGGASSSLVGEWSTKPQTQAPRSLLVVGGWDGAERAATPIRICG
jgi:hypothetical protein